MRLYHSGAAAVSGSSLPARLPLRVGRSKGMTSTPGGCPQLCHVFLALGLLLDAEANRYP